MKSVWRKAAVRLVLLAAICSAIFLLAERVFYRSTVDHARAETMESVGRLRLSFERALNADVQRVRGLVAYVRGNPDIDQAEFESVARYLLSDKTAFTRNVALARDLVITHIHPMEGNRDALGLDYRDSPAQWPMVARTIRTQEIAIAGPLDLVQGGRGVIARVPVFLDAADGAQERLWGIASIVIDYEGLLRHVNLSRFRQDLAIRISRSDPATGTRSVFLDADAEVAAPAVSERVRFPNGAWRIEAAPRGGWPTRSNEFWWIVLATALAFLVGLSLIAMNVRFESALVRSAAETERARRAAVEAKTLAEKANAAKTVFLANMSHELRTPLNAIIGYAEIMKTRLFGPLGNARYQGYVEDIHASGRFLLDIVDDVLDLSRLEATDQRLKPARVDVREVVREALTVQGDAGADVRLEVEEGALAHADVRALKHVLINVIGNAIKHGEGERIEIRVLRPDRDWVAIRVADHGPGIPPDVLPRVTEPFYTGAEGTWAAKEEGKGTGIGLALAKRLTEAMGGTLSVNSQLGAGTTVEIALPAFADTAAA